MAKKVTIVISGPPGAGTSVVSKRLAKRLNLGYFSPGRVFKSYSAGREARRALNVWKTKGKDKKFHKFIDKMQVEKAKRGNVVICGKLSIHILKGLADYKIWIDSPLELRAKRTASRDKASFEEALEEVKEREKIERTEWKRIYGIDYFNLKNEADFVVHGTGKTVDDVVKEILEFMERNPRHVKTYIKFLEPFERELHKRIKKRGLTITVSGSSGSGKSTGARAIAKALGLRYIFAGEIQRRIAKERGISLEEQVKMRGPEIDYEMDKRNLKFAMRGNCVIDARLSGWCAGDWADARIFYICPLGIRAKRIAKRDNTSVRRARESIMQRDREDNRKYRKLYGIDLFDKSIYDIIIDNGKLNKRQAKTVPIKLVKEFLKSKHLKN